MDSQLYMLRAKKLGIKLTLARQKMNLSLEDLAQKMGMQPDEINQFEKGITPPSLPQIQVLSSILEMPIDDLVNTQVLEPIQQEISPDSLPRYFEIRNKMLGIQIKKNRFQQNQSLEQLSTLCEISASDLEMYESGVKPIPLPVLQKISEVLQLPYGLQQRVESLPQTPISEETNLEIPPMGDVPTEVSPLPQPVEAVDMSPSEPIANTEDWQSLVTEPESEEKIKEEINEATVLPEEWQSLVTEPATEEPIKEGTSEATILPEEWQSLVTETDSEEPAKEGTSDTTVLPKEWQSLVSQTDAQEGVEEQKGESPAPAEEWHTPEPEPLAATDTIPAETTDVLSDIESLQQVYAAEPLSEPETITPSEMSMSESVSTPIELSEEIHDFINNPVNQPYLELALKLSRMDAKKLREIAESLLEITL